MNPRFKAVLAVVAGLVTGSLLILVLELLSSERPPDGIDITDKVAMKAWIDTLPMKAFVILLLVYFLGAIAAGYVANVVARSTKYRPALIAGAGLLVSGIMNLIDIPHPMWFAVVSSLLFLAGAWVGGRIAIQQESRK